MTKDEVHLWYAFTDRAGDLESCRALLSPDEITRLDRLMKKDDRLRFVIAHALARTALSSYTEVSPEDWWKVNSLGMSGVLSPVQFRESSERSSLRKGGRCSWTRSVIWP